MKQNLKLLISSLIALTFVSPQVIYDMEDLSTLEAQKTPSGIQLKGADDTTEAEQQRIKLQETEPIEKQEKVSLCSFGIDKTFQYHKDLGNYDLTYGELLKVLEAMKIYYTGEEQIKLCINEYPILSKDKVQGYLEWINKEGYSDASEVMVALRKRVEQLIAIIIKAIDSKLTTIDINTKLGGGGCGLRNFVTSKIGLALAKVLYQKMENYRILQGTNHPRWDDLKQNIGIGDIEEWEF